MVMEITVLNHKGQVESPTGEKEKQIRYCWCINGKKMQINNCINYTN